MSKQENSLSSGDFTKGSLIHGISLFLLFIFIITIVYLGYYYKKWFDLDHPDHEDDLLRKYLLNENPLYGFNKPKLWIFNAYDINARQWKNFGSRNNFELNQPILFKTIESIIIQNSDDFHICLIDDDSFGRLLPDWDYCLEKIAEPTKTKLRKLGLMKILYKYGGFLVPNSFYCLKPLFLTWSRATRIPVADKVPETPSPSEKKMFVFERINRHCMKGKPLLFIPDDYFMGVSERKHPVLGKYIEFLSQQNLFHSTSETLFNGKSNSWLLKESKLKNISVLDGSLIGIKDKKGQPVPIEELIGSGDGALLGGGGGALLGIYIPEDEILSRHCYKWFGLINSSISEKIVKKVATSPTSSPNLGADEVQKTK